MFTWSKAEVRAYLEALGYQLDPNPGGQVHIPGPSRACRERRHRATMSILTGEWHCPACSAGPLEDYAARQIGAFWTSMSHARLGAESIRETIREAEDQRRERAQHAKAASGRLALTKAAARLLRKVIREPGVTRTRLYRAMHMARTRFQATARELQRYALISHHDQPSTGGRIQRRYFPRPSLNLVSGENREP
jgi:hypothetical protein